MKFLLLCSLPLCSLAFFFPEEFLKNQEKDVNKKMVKLPSYLSEIDESIDESAAIGRRMKRQIPIKAKKWPGNNVNFFFDSIVPINENNKASVLAAQEFIQSRTCVNFVEHKDFNPFTVDPKTAPNIIAIYKGAGCNSDTGMKGGLQGLSLVDGCTGMGAAAHELMHALGVNHMQQRSDRDNFITVNTTAIKASQKDIEKNFGKTLAGEDFMYTPYEYGSVMHYGANDFGKDSQSITMNPKDKRYLYTLGNNRVSFYDIQMINAFYGCDEKCKTATSAKCKNGGVPNPRNCAVCNCPRGYGGPLCDQRPSGCGQTLTATAEWQRGTSTNGEYQKQTVAETASDCNIWITAPAGKQIEVNFLFMNDLRCEMGCSYNGIEIKSEADSKIVSPIFCCKESFNQVIKSPLNPTPIISYSRNTYSSVIFEYRFVDGPMKPTTPLPSPPQTCKDTVPFCEELSAWGYCTSEPVNKAKANCAKSCGLCNDEDCIDPDCILSLRMDGNRR